MTLLAPALGLACDQCSIQIGNVLQSEGHFIGYSYRFRMLHGTIGGAKTLGGSKHLDHFDQAGETKELFIIHEVYGNYRLSEKLHLSAAMPLVNNFRASDGYVLTDVYGMGDPWLMLRRQDRKKRERGTTVWSAGIGVKFPFGQTDLTDNETVPDLDMQPGTGSTDLIADLTLYHGLDRVTLLSQLSFKWAGEGAEGFTYGNSLSHTVLGGYKVMKENEVQLDILTGVYQEYLGRDALNKEAKGSSSYNLFGELSALIAYKRVRGRASMQRVMLSDIDPRYLPTIYRLNFSIQYDI
jgi:hypothetical protein